MTRCRGFANLGVPGPALLKSVSMYVSHTKTKKLMEEVDTNNSGCIEFDELVAVLQGYRQTEWVTSGKLRNCCCCRHQIRQARDRIKVLSATGVAYQSGQVPLKTALCYVCLPMCFSFCSIFLFLWLQMWIVFRCCCTSFFFHFSLRLFLLGQLNAYGQHIVARR